jgi:Rrf2 family protein
MKMTRASNYALHAVAYMAAQDQDVPIASHIIAEKRGIPKRFLLKVLKPLVSARVLTSVKGPEGGYRLARPAKDVSLLEVIEAVDGPIRGYAPGSRKRANSLDRRLDEICAQSAEKTRQQLGQIKITELSD